MSKLPEAAASQGSTGSSTVNVTVFSFDELLKEPVTTTLYSPASEDFASEIDNTLSVDITVELSVVLYHL